MRYGRILAVIIIGIVAFYAYKFITLELEHRKTARYNKYARVIAETAAASEIYRYQPDSFLIVRDSILSNHDLTLDSIDAFRDEFDGKQGEWTPVWNEVKRITDSLLNAKLDSLVSDTLKDSVTLR